MTSVCDDSSLQTCFLAILITNAEPHLVDYVSTGPSVVGESLACSWQRLIQAREAMDASLSLEAIKTHPPVWNKRVGALKEEDPQQEDRHHMALSNSPSHLSTARAHLIWRKSWCPTSARPEEESNPWG